MKDTALKIESLGPFKRGFKITWPDGKTRVFKGDATVQLFPRKQKESP